MVRRIVLIEIDKLIEHNKNVMNKSHFDKAVYNRSKGWIEALEYVKRYYTVSSK